MRKQPNLERSQAPRNRTSLARNSGMCTMALLPPHGGNIRKYFPKRESSEDRRTRRNTTTNLARRYGYIVQGTKSSLPRLGRVSLCKTSISTEQELFTCEHLKRGPSNLNTSPEVQGRTSQKRQSAYRKLRAKLLSKPSFVTKKMPRDYRHKAALPPSRSDCKPSSSTEK